MTRQWSSLWFPISISHFPSFSVSIRCLESLIRGEPRRLLPACFSWWVFLCSLVVLLVIVVDLDLESVVALLEALGWVHLLFSCGPFYYHVQDDLGLLSYHLVSFSGRTFHHPWLLCIFFWALFHCSLLEVAYNWHIPADHHELHRLLHLLLLPRGSSLILGFLYQLLVVPILGCTLWLLLITASLMSDGTAMYVSHMGTNPSLLVQRTQVLWPVIIECMKMHFFRATS